VHDEEIAELVLRDSELAAACARLVELANARGGEDNITVAIVRCDGADPGEVSASH
jgi:serine/threonine protein phosphatase PrpC